MMASQSGVANTYLYSKNIPHLFEVSTYGFISHTKYMRYMVNHASSESSDWTNVSQTRGPDSLPAELLRGGKEKRGSVLLELFRYHHQLQECLLTDKATSTDTETSLSSYP